MNDSECFASALNVGDEVIVSSWGRGADRIARVEKATKARVVVGGLLYRRSDGCQVGGSVWQRSRLLEATGEARAEVITAVRRARLIAEIRASVEGITRTTLGINALEHIHAALAPLRQASSDSATEARGEHAPSHNTQTGVSLLPDQTARET